MIALNPESLREHPCHPCIIKDLGPKIKDLGPKIKDLGPKIKDLRLQN